MDVDLNFEVWLKTYSQSQPAIIVPYVQSSQSQLLRYQINASNEGKSGTSRTSQSGYTSVQANQPQALTRLVISRSDTQRCDITIVIENTQGKQKQFSFDCSDDSKGKP